MFKRMKPVFFTLILIILIANACSTASRHQEKEKDKPSDKPIDRGVVYKSVQCLNYALSYSLYWPLNQRNSELPLLVFFDPSGKGNVPVEKYSKLAEKYGFILAGLNDSKNGMQWDQVQTIALSVIEDCINRYPVQKERIYACGFSGGSRYAMALALTSQQITGIIGCGAALPAVNQQAVRSFNWCGIVGMEDFNYLEMRNMDESLKETPIRHILIEFEGNHEWPSENVMNDGFLWLETEAVRANLIKVDTLLFQELNNILAETTWSISHPALLERELARKMKMMEGIVSQNGLEKELDKLQQSSSLQRDKQLENLALKKEIQMQEFYLQSLLTKDIDWWTTEAGHLWQKTKSTDFYEAKAYQRTLNYISLACFMQCSQGFKQNKNVFYHFLKLYEMVDPDNPDMFYFKALGEMMEKQPEKALESLRKSIENGFNDQEKLLKEETFRPLYQKKEWNELMNSLKSE